MDWTLDAEAVLSDGVIRWRAFGDGDIATILVHGTPYSSFLWRDIAVGLSRRGRRVYVFDHLGYGQSDKREGQDLTLAARAGASPNCCGTGTWTGPAWSPATSAVRSCSVPSCSKARRIPT